MKSPPYCKFEQPESLTYESPTNLGTKIGKVAGKHCRKR